MKRFLLDPLALSLILVGASAHLRAQAGPANDSQAPVRVFERGEHGYHTFRIPAIVRCQDGGLLAFAEGRVRGSGDAGDIDVVLKRSDDGGASWGALQVIADHEEGTIGNPTPVVERASGDVVLVLTCAPDGASESEIRSGRKGRRDPWIMRSQDGGRSWSEPRSIADGAKSEAWRWYATGPCHAIQLRGAPFAGRLVVPVNHSLPGGAGNDQLGVHLLLSDDGGKSWRIGAIDDQNVGNDVINPNETTLVELADGRLYVNARDQHGTSGATRAYTYSSDGGESFTHAFSEEPALLGPVCQASLIAAGSVEGETRLLFSGPSTPGARARLAIRCSDDSGQHWKEQQVLHEGPAAYSDLVSLGGRRFGCLFEGDDYSWIGFTTFEDSGAAGAVAAQEEAAWVSLFNGKDLDGWTPKIRGQKLGEDPLHTFRVEDGVLKVSYDQYDKFEGRFGHLFFEDSFSNYRLRVEYRFTGEQLPDGAGWAWRNSGVMIHGQAPETMGLEQDFPVSIEVQLLGGPESGERSTANLCTPGTNVVFGEELVRRHCTNSSSKTYRGDQWVTVEVEVHGNGLIRHLIDGVSVLEYQRSQLDPDDGDARPLIGAGGLMLGGGSISLQSESHPVEFRRVEIQKLAD